MSAVENETAEQLYEKGKLCVSRGRYAEAIRCFREALARLRSFAECWNELGNAQLVVGDADGAAFSFLKATMIRPDFVEAWYNREAALLLLGEYAEVIKCIDEILRLEPRNADAWLDKGKLLMRLGRVSEATACFENAARLKGEVKVCAAKKRAPCELALVKKICLVGDARVGKTSLVRRYVWNLFDEHYLTTIGAKITKKTVTVNVEGEDKIVTLMLWDIEGEKDRALHQKYYRGADGALIVCDITRRKTFENLRGWFLELYGVAGTVPIVCVVNKVDLDASAAFSINEFEGFAKKLDAVPIATSAKTGRNVENAFSRILEMVL
jgi:small GTP-binding protein